MSDVIAADIAEYTAIRAEVDAFHNVEGQVMSITVALIGALVVFITAVLSGQIQAFRIGDDQPFLHLVPLPFVALGIIFAYTQVRIVQAAAYIQKSLRGRVMHLLRLTYLQGQNPNFTEADVNNIWRWEIFRRESAEYPVRSLATCLNSARWVFFLSPSLIPLSAWNRHLDNVGSFLVLSWDLALPIFLLVLAAWTSVSLPKKVVA
jgi:hypothetical protein